MVLIQGKEYVTVAERINIVHERSESVDIQTEILINNEKFVLVKAVIKIDDRMYTGHAHEVVGSSEVNITSAIENAETSAVGRALAFAGIGVNRSIASSDEMEKVNKSKPRATNQQIRKLKDLLDDENVTSEEKVRIEKMLKSDILKESAIGILNYFLGRSEYIDGAWKKVTSGILSDRRLLSRAE